MAKNISIENARILFRNFSGKATQYNAEGDRNFCVILENRELVQQMTEDGWNVRYLKPRDPDEEPQPYVQVKVSYKNRPPKVVLVTSRGMTNLDEDTVGVLDWAEISNVDLVINPYQWSIGGRTGVKGYVKAIYVTIVEDDFAAKYDAPESSALDGLPF